MTCSSPTRKLLQQDNTTSTSAMRVKRSVDCLLSAPAEPGEAALRWPCIDGGVDAARQRGRGAFRGACSCTLQMMEWSVLWHVPVEASQELHAADL